MCFLKRFWFCLHLYTGCLIIAFTGLVIGILGLLLVILKVHDEVSTLFFVLALIFVILYLVSKFLLLVGTIRGTKILLLVSLIIMIFCLIYLIGLCIWQICAKETALRICLLAYFIVVEIYYAWVVLSYWNLVRNCCADEIEVKV